MTNAATHRAIYSRANGGFAHMTNEELWNVIVDARNDGEHETLDKATRELERRQAVADKFTSTFERCVVIGGLVLCAACGVVFVLGILKLIELCSDYFPG